jgi:O-antigen ligase
LKFYKIIALTLTVFFLSILLIPQLSDFQDLFTSVFSSDSKKIYGSSSTLRFEQFEGALNEISDSPLVGKGFGWTGYYSSIKGDHPVMLAFESLIIVILCNNGFIGLIIWFIFFILILKLNRKITNVKTDILFLDLTLGTYVLYSIGTGDFGYLQYFSTFYTFKIINCLNQSQTQAFQNIKIRLNHIDAKWKK